MTCRKADELMEQVLDGEVDEESAVDLREHLSDCERCADAWHATWQVRSLLTECDPPDPGEGYFEQATACIMDRVAALRTQDAPAEEPPIISSMRYGPLSVRGAGAAFVFALSVLVGSFVSCPREAARPVGAGVRDVKWLPVRVTDPSVDRGWTFCGVKDRSNVRNHANHDANHMLHNRTRIPETPLPLVTDAGRFVYWSAPPSMSSTPQPAM